MVIPLIFLIYPDALFYHTCIVIVPVVGKCFELLPMRYYTVK